MDEHEGAVGTDSTATDGDHHPTQVEFADGPIVAEFSHCDTVRVTGNLSDVILSLFWWDEDGQIGTISEPVGGVDDEREVSATDEFGDFTHGPILTGLECFTGGGPVVPGAGAVELSNPTVDACIAAVRSEHDGPEELESPFDRSASTLETTE
ncbi:uncharacterized protein Nmag_3417 [Natrialba magadii ATCC 43099]|uniref:Uncharacterized protein n=1 Tax=Natrialba magadii (strain ATCC 43099 / DSM 3394 / CCM 3739 / CIP 104546 / IAM 13178 / JCM 8861 / NBRC 102185 / NCIMB 2190 / MS3) TaxID=547559 RepID=D3STA0_NATMM|nr:hypothetical protein [Natrialba magadii]ADD06967.1 uncharacterized protein Nmag_3417 [Natrialba magadii ATCC 43099]ELY28890.1 hypothetical protein C500_13130 [Natrialba magadii ATCC 43099]